MPVGMSLVQSLNRESGPLKQRNRLTCQIPTGVRQILPQPGKVAMLPSRSTDIDSTIRSDLTRSGELRKATTPVDKSTRPFHPLSKMGFQTFHPALYQP